MSDVPRSLDAEDESVRRGLIPALKVFRLLQRIKCSVYLYRGEYAGCVFKLTVLWKTRGIENASPRWVAPAGNTDECFTRHRFSFAPAAMLLRPLNGQVAQKNSASGAERHPYC